MANRISAGTGNWSNGSSVWRDCSAAGAQISGAASTGLTGTAADSPSIAGNNDVTEGVLLQIATRPGSTGTITVTLRLLPSTDQETITLDVADLPGNASEGGWIFVKWSTTRTLSSGSNYVVRLSASASSLVNMAVLSAGGSDWNRVFRKNSFVSMAAGDRAWVIGEYTGQANPQPANTYTVTQDNNNTTNYGELVVGPGGMLTASTGADTELRIAGNITVCGGGSSASLGGVLNLGTSGGRIGSSFRAWLKPVLTSEGQYGLEVLSGGTYRMYGRVLTNCKCKLAQDAAAAATSVITDLNSSGWAAGGSGDLLLLESTGRPGTGTQQSEVKRISSIADHATYGETITIESGLVFAKAGLAPFQCDVYNLSRNAQFKPSTAVDPLGGGASSVPPFTLGTHYATWMRFRPGAIVELDWAYIQDVGSSMTTGRRGLEVETAAASGGAFTAKFCSVVNARVNGLSLATASGNHDNYTVEDSCFFNMAVVTGPGINVFTTTGTAGAMRRNHFVQRNAAGGAQNVFLGDCGMVFTDNVIVGGYHGVVLQEALSAGGLQLDNNTVHSCAYSGLLINASLRNATLQGWTVRRNGDSASGAGSAGVLFNAATHCLALKSFNLFGNYNNVNLNASTFALRFYDSSFHGDSGFSSQRGFYFPTAPNAFTLELWNCDVGGNLGAYTSRATHVVADVDVPNSGQVVQLILVGSTTGSSSEFGSSQSSWAQDTRVQSARHNKTANTHKALNWAGTISRDGTYYRSASPSEKLTPLVASRKLESSPKHVAVAASQTVTVSVRVRADTSYGSVAPRLMMRRYDAANQGGGAAQTYYASDQIIALHSGTKSAAAAPDAAGFESLSGAIAYAPAEDTVLEFFVDCEGTAGFVNVEDWALA